MNDRADGDARQGLRDTVHACLERHSAPREFLAEPADVTRTFDRVLWQRLCAEIGVSGLILPPDYGGSGGSMSDLIAVFEEVGAALAPVPLFATAGMVVPALLSVDTTGHADDVIAAIASGSLIATLAVTEDDETYRPSATTVIATAEHTGWTLSGQKAFIVDGTCSDVLVVPARTETGIGLFAVDAGGEGVALQGMRSLDLLRSLARLTLADAPARLIGVDERAGAHLDSAIELSAIVLAAEQAGGAQRCLDNAVDYAKTRVQFDRPIGSFQAIKHTLVDLLLDAQLARSLVIHAGAVADAYLAEPTPDSARELSLTASLARSLCSESYMRAADEALHVHGGLGFTWEHDSHLHYRRAKFCELLLGTPAEHRQRAATAAGM